MYPSPTQLPVAHCDALFQKKLPKPNNFLFYFRESRLADPTRLRSPQSSGQIRTIGPSSEETLPALPQ